MTASEHEFDAPWNLSWYIKTSPPTCRSFALSRLESKVRQIPGFARPVLAVNLFLPLARGPLKYLHAVLMVSQVSWDIAQ